FIQILIRIDFYEAGRDGTCRRRVDAGNIATACAVNCYCLIMTPGISFLLHRDIHLPLEAGFPKPRIRIRAVVFIYLPILGLTDDDALSGDIEPQVIVLRMLLELDLIFRNRFPALVSNTMESVVLDEIVDAISVLMVIDRPLDLPGSLKYL